MMAVMARSGTRAGQRHSAGPSPSRAAHPTSSPRTGLAADHGTPQPGAADAISPPRCALCNLRRPGDETVVDGAPHRVVHLDADIVALVDADALHVLVAPRSHREGLATGPRDAGPLLGALRRVVDAVASATGSPDCRLEPLDDLPVAPRHACYRVRPSPAGSPEAEPVHERALDVERLTAALGRSGATLRGAGRSSKAPSLG